MARSFRDALDSLEAEGELRRISREIDIRYVGALVEKSDKALLFENVAGYEMPVVAGLLGSPKRTGIAFGCDHADIHSRLKHGVNNPIPCVQSKSPAVREVEYQTGDDVDLYSLPVPLFAELDGGPMITAGVIVAKEENGSLNAGAYRLMIREKNLTCIDIVTPNDMRRIAEKNTAQNKSTPISINIGTNPAVTWATAYRPPPHVNELEIAGGIMGEALELAPCKTIDVPCIADCEIVLEGEILPTGWVKPEGRFGEFHRSMGALHWNPHVRINAIYTREKPNFWAFHMPWEVICMSAPIFETSLRRSLREANINVHAVNITVGGCCYFHAVVSIQARVGDGKIALMAALASADFKHVVVVDDDIDVFNALEVERAVATRFQADKDLVIVSGARAKPLDPSLELVTGRMPTTAKMGIDATIPVDLPRERFQRVVYAFEDEIDVEAYLADESGTADPVPEEDIDIAKMMEKISEQLLDGDPMYYSEIVKQEWDSGFENVNRALAKLHENGLMWQDELGRVCHKDSPHAAKPPSSKLTNRA